MENFFLCKPRCVKQKGIKPSCGFAQSSSHFVFKMCDKHSAREVPAIYALPSIKTFVIENNFIFTAVKLKSLLRSFRFNIEREENVV